MSEICECGQRKLRFENPVRYACPGGSTHQAYLQRRTDENTKRGTAASKRNTGQKRPASKKNLPWRKK